MIIHHAAVVHTYPAQTGLRSFAVRIHNARYDADNKPAKGSEGYTDTHVVDEGTQKQSNRRSDGQAQNYCHNKNRFRRPLVPSKRFHNDHRPFESASAAETARRFRPGEGCGLYAGRRRLRNTGKCLAQLTASIEI